MVQASFYEKKQYFCATCGSELVYQRIKNDDDEDYMVLAHSKDAVTSGSPACKLAGRTFSIPEDHVMDLKEVKHAR